MSAQDEKKIRICLIGAGGWGYQHARIFSARPDVHFLAVCGRNLEKTKKRADEFRVRAYTDIQKMLETEKPDLVAISLPNQAHFDPTLHVIRAGIPLFVEKPFVFELAEAQQLIHEAADKKLFFAINFNHRYAKPVVLASEAIRSGRVGEIVFASWRFGGEGGTDHAFNNLIETQCHGFDMLEFLCGPIDSIMAQMTDKTAPGKFRTLVLALRFKNGAVGSLIGSYDSSYAYPNTHSVEINGTRGRILIEDTVKRYTFNAAGSEIAEVWQAGYFNDRDRDFHQTFDRHVDALLAAFKSKQPPPIHARAGQRALQLAHAAIESFHTGRRIEIDPTTYTPSSTPAAVPPSPHP